MSCQLVSQILTQLLISSSLEYFLGNYPKKEYAMVLMLIKQRLIIDADGTVKSFTGHCVNIPSPIYKKPERRKCKIVSRHRPSKSPAVSCSTRVPTEKTRHVKCETPLRPNLIFQRVKKPKTQEGNYSERCYRTSGVKEKEWTDCCLTNIAR